MAVLLHPSSAETRQRLLEAAGEVFAEYGFHNATIRDICSRAEANIAAVNYHFGDKERLYATVLTYAHHCAVEKYPPDFGLQPNAPPEERLRAFVRSLMLRIFDGGRPAWYGKLLSREMVEPTGALDALVDREMKDRAELLEQIVRDLIGPDASAELVRLCALSVAGQGHFYHHARPLLTRLYPEIKYEIADIEHLADHITRFSLAALKAMVPHPPSRRRTIVSPERPVAS